MGHYRVNRGFLALPFLMLLNSSPASAAPCESLTALSLDDTRIMSATLTLAGSFTPPADSVDAPPGPIQVPGFCRVIARIRPAITVEVWLPLEGWNGGFQGVGGGGFAGVISYSNLGAALRQGHATASTDTGHTGGSASFALGHPELVVDFAYRAVHEMTVKAKAIVNAFYGTPATRSYFVGCSLGGRQGLLEAQRYPSDYDGIVTGAAAAFPSRYNASQLWVASATLMGAGRDRACRNQGFPFHERQYQQVQTTLPLSSGRGVHGIRRYQ